MNGTVNEVREAANGDLLAVGSFTIAGDVACNSIARWHGGAWQPIGAGSGGIAYHVFR